MRCPECGMEIADPTRPCARCGAPAAWQPVPGRPVASQQAERCTARDDGYGFEITGISGQMMRVFSSRRESITADLRVRAAQFEQRYGRAPSQRELAQLAQAFKIQDAQPQARRAGLRAGARGLGRQARADPRHQPGLSRAVSVARRNRPRGRARARAATSPARSSWPAPHRKPSRWPNRKRAPGPAQT